MVATLLTTATVLAIAIDWISNTKSIYDTKCNHNTEKEKNVKKIYTENRSTTINSNSKNNTKKSTSKCLKVLSRVLKAMYDATTEICARAILTSH
ncbi:hypothetical protein PGKDCPLP_00749 [Stenotrophomonas maltophilia]|uniref:hypothetical protein n=1 Tax=Stenotrophomonas sp. TD3 TaxID=1641707 RepID=UPI000B09E5D8|nr:hypothetical protein [Stenotrophomonas sp. TD3]VUL69826.1 hypothetical protein PGKDCPLP_00749 [Stenotrophomonas maltophilia]